MILSVVKRLVLGHRPYHTFCFSLISTCLSFNFFFFFFNSKILPSILVSRILGSTPLNPWPILDHWKLDQPQLSKRFWATVQRPHHCSQAIPHKKRFSCSIVQATISVGDCCGPNLNVSCLLGRLQGQSSSCILSLGLLPFRFSVTWKGHQNCSSFYSVPEGFAMILLSLVWLQGPVLFSFFWFSCFPQTLS